MTPTSIPVDAPEDNHGFDSASPDPHTTLKIVITMWICGWIVFGIISILCINGQGRAGRWVPEWYLDSKGTARDKLAIVGWWLAILLFWPLIWLGYLVRMLFSGIRGWIKNWRRDKHQEKAGEGSV
ncbi:hypothetical protein FDECE_12940 [Fusarium decemcellulare]|nr:hypothetical protein FDECE_12940 [Fusarium decemcellulare]